MSSVSPVSNTEFRANASAQPPAAGDDPFSLLLNAVTDAKPARADAAPQPERRDDAPPPATKSKPRPQARTETEDRQAKRRADEPEAKQKKNAAAAAAPAPAAVPEEEVTGETDGAGLDAVEILLALTPDAAAPATPAVAPDVTAQTPVIAAETVVTQAEGEAELNVQSAPAATTPATPANSSANAQPPAIGPQAQAQAAAPATAAQTNAEAKTEATAQTSSDAAKVQAAPKDAASFEAQPQTQPGNVNVQSAATLHRPLPASLEALNEALTKHAQSQVSADGQWQPEPAQKPAMPSNAVMPNFAFVTNVANVSDVRVQTTAESARAVPLESLAVEIATRAKNGERRFDIRLDPPELGRIDVRLEIDHKGNTTTKLIVERAETLDLLQRDARGLEKALQSAGLKTDAGGLEFSLRQDAQTHQQSNVPQTGGARGEVAAENETTVQAVAVNASLHAQLRGGVDIRI